MNLANKISIGRILVIPFFVASILYYQSNRGIFSYLPLILFSLAVISDGIDGFIARRFNQKTHLGTILDPIADKLLLITAYLCLSMAEGLPADIKLPAWVSVIVISRDMVIILGAIIIYIIAGKVEAEPTVLGKMTTFFQMMTIIAVLTHFQFAYILWSVAVILTIASGIDYIVKGSRQLNET